MDKNDYSSVDKLIDFGMGLSIAKQMTETMNSAINNMEIPGSKIPKKDNNDYSSYFIEMDGKPAGPFSEIELKTLIQVGKITKSSLIWKQGMTSWEKIQDVPEALRLFLLAGPLQEKSSDEN